MAWSATSEVVATGRFLPHYRLPAGFTESIRPDRARSDRDAAQGVQPLADLLGGERPGEVVALGEAVAQPVQRVRLLRRLDALGHRLQVQAVGDLDHRGRDDRLLRGPADAVDERLV